MQGLAGGYRLPGPGRREAGARLCRSGEAAAVIRIGTARPAPDTMTVPSHQASVAAGSLAARIRQATATATATAAQ